MDAFVWNMCFVTGLEDVDTQHKRLVELINRVGKAVTAGDTHAGEGLASVLDELEDYAKSHFELEESLMYRFGLATSFVDAHNAFHDRFFEDLLRMRVAAEGGSTDAGRALLDFLIHWLAHHILGTDQLMAHQIQGIQAGRSPEDALADNPGASPQAMQVMLSALGGLFAQLSERNRELERLNATLEARVAVRTRALETANRRLAALAHTDSLTGLPNRRHAIHYLSLEWKRATKGNVPLSAMMVDVDGFKVINDSHGHEAGDRLLGAVARSMANSVRSDDLVCRLGGDEFLIVCPDTSLEGALRVAENVRRATVELRHGPACASVSIGVACRTPPQGGWKDLLRAADRAVYRAKAAGRDCVRHAS